HRGQPVLSVGGAALAACIAHAAPGYPAGGGCDRGLARRCPRRERSIAGMSARAAQGQDVEAGIDAARISGLQWKIFVLCAMIMFVDGFDLQALSLTVPYM